jgi:DeoR/GlpR family transcriptional regulator of sugar metabolism/ABC-type sugar transport system substrate-binding protein
MKLSQRQNSIFTVVYKKRSVSTEKLSEAFSFSRETLRKELVFLESQGLIERRYGKISCPDNEPVRRFIREEQRVSVSQRRKQILEILKDHKQVRLSALAARMRVSVITIRSDLEQLALEGKVVRKHGSASLLPPAVNLFESVQTSDFSSKTNILGEHTLLHISPGDTIYLGGGEIAMYVAVSLPQNANVSIVSDNFDIVSILLKRNYASPLYILPGEVLSASGSLAVKHGESFLSGIHIDKAFFMIASYADGTYFMETPEAAANAAAVSGYAKKLYFVLDSLMLDKRGSYPFPYRDYRDKVQEILIDDGVGQPVVSYLFPRRDPVVIYGANYALKIGQRRKYRIGLLIDKRGYFIQSVYHSVQESAATYDNLSLIIRETGGGFFSTVKNAEILLNDRPDLIINFSLCAESPGYIAEKCRARGVKLITIDLQCPDSVYFGADNTVAGTLAGDHIVSFIQRSWYGRLDRIVILARCGMDHIINQRVMSAVERIRSEIYCSFPDPEIIEWDNPNDKPREKLMRLLLDTPKSSHILFIAFNLSFLMDSYDLILQYRDANNTIIVGQNFNEQVKELMKKPGSLILGCVDYNPKRYGNQVFDIALRMLNGETVERENYTTHSWISKEAVLAGDYEKTNA